MTSNRFWSRPLETRALFALALSCGLACGGSGSTDDSGSAAGGATNSSTGAGEGGPGTGGMRIIGTGGSIQFDAGQQGDGSHADSPDGCGLSSIRSSTKIVNVLLVIDRSGSMTATPAGFTTDKWTAIKSALSGALDKVKGGISMGLELFPNNLVTPIPTACTSECWDMPAGDAAVVVPVAAGTTSLPAILAKLAPMPAGGTPTAHALQLASDYFTTGAGKSLAGDKYVLLATDGGPNGNPLTCDAMSCTTNLDANKFTTNYCDPNLVPDGPKLCLDEAATVAQLSTMAAAGIKTFVVGIPGTDPYIPTLDKMAVAGGVPASMTSPKYFAVSAAGGVAGLQQVFETITKQLITSCRLQLQSVPPDTGLLNVYIDGKVLPQSGPDGWDLDTSTSPPTIVLKGATCTNIEANGASTIEVQYGCPTMIVR